MQDVSDLESNDVATAACHDETHLPAGKVVVRLHGPRSPGLAWLFDPGMSGERGLCGYHAFKDRRRMHHASKQNAGRPAVQEHECRAKEFWHLDSAVSTPNQPCTNYAQRCGASVHAGGSVGGFIIDGDLLGMPVIPSIIIFIHPQLSSAPLSLLVTRSRASVSQSCAGRCTSPSLSSCTHFPTTPTPPCAFPFAHFRRQLSTNTATQPSINISYPPIHSNQTTTSLHPPAQACLNRTSAFSRRLATPHSSTFLTKQHTNERTNDSSACFELAELGITVRFDARRHTARAQGTHSDYGSGPGATTQDNQDTTRDTQDSVVGGSTCAAHIPRTSALSVSDLCRF